MSFASILRQCGGVAEEVGKAALPILQTIPQTRAAATAAGVVLNAVAPLVQTPPTGSSVAVSGVIPLPPATKPSTAALPVSTVVAAAGAVSSVVSAVQSSIQKQEITNPTGGGATKSAAVHLDLSQYVSFMQEILSANGLSVSYDANLLQSAIDSQVAAYNSLAAFQASF